MTRARKRVPVGRRLTRLGRPVLAVGLLAALGWAAFVGVSRSTGATETGRRADRLQVIQATAASASTLLDAGAQEAAAVADRARAAGAGASVDTYTSSPHRFREALVVNRALHVSAGNQRYAGSDGALLACRDAGGNPIDNGLRELVQTALQTGAPVLRAFDDPTCKPVVAAAVAPANGPVAVVLADPTALAARLDTLAHLPNAHAVLLDPAGASVGADGTVGPPPADPTKDDFVSYMATRRGHEGITNVDSVVRAWVPLTGSWVVVVDQSAPEATYYTVVAGDTLSKISKTNYGDPNKYMKIFEANKPMLSDPNKIYPGQVLRVPPL